MYLEIKWSLKIPDDVSLFYLFLSLIGLALLPFLTFNFQKTSSLFTFQKQFIGATFIGIYFTGILVGVFPSKCSQILHFRQQKNSDTVLNIEETSPSLNFNGHHPICENFTSHVLSLRGKIYCAGCTGLIGGAMFSIFFSFLYYFFDLDVGGMGALVFWLGFFGVFCGLLQYQILQRTQIPQIKVLVNAIFVIGSFLLSVGIYEITGNLLLELYLVLLSLYWIMTRIYTSQISHHRICANCGIKSCNFV